MKKILSFMRNLLLFPLVLLIGIPEGANSTTDGASGEPPDPSANTPNAQSIASEILNALEKRSQRFEGSISRSVAEKHGMTEEEVAELLAAEKKKRDNILPEAARKQIDEALARSNERLLMAEISMQAAVLGFRDSDVAAALIDRTKVKVNDNGSVDGVREALEEVIKAKPYLVKDTNTGAWGERHGGSPSTKTGVEAEFARLNPKLKF